ncbi:MAG: hypothetical protein ACREVA_12790, partial [Burkholderiales bacterium]
QYCALGVVGHSRGIDMSRLASDDYDHLAKVFGISSALVQEIERINDDPGTMDPWMRWESIYAWGKGNLNQ